MPQFVRPNGHFLQTTAMLNRIIAFSLNNRLLTMAVATVMLLLGGYRAAQLPIDVFPDLNRPTVTIMTEAGGLAPQEVEMLVTWPIESVMNGANRVQRVRSASGIGISLIWVEFDWGTDIFVARQMVAEKLQLVRPRLPRGVNPVMTPITSIMGEIMLVGMYSTGNTDPMEVRTLADWIVRPQLLATSGVAQVTIMGGELRQFQVLTNPDRLARYGVTLDELTQAVQESSAATGGGFLVRAGEESQIRIVGRAATLDDLSRTVVKMVDQAPITVAEVADVVYGGPVQRGTGSLGGEPAVIMSIQKQPAVDTLELTREIESTLAQIQERLPEDVHIDTSVFKQATFIQVAIHNVLEAIRDGAIWVILVLFLFLWNLRTSVITLTAIPLSILTTALVFHYFEISINTMTLGGLAVAIGELVDDSIVDIENIFRRLRENRLKPVPDHPLRVIYQASSEIRNSIVYATLIVVVVVFPLFFLAGLEGRMFAPLGLSYLITLLASLAVSLTVTPVLAYYLLPSARFLARPRDPWLLRILKRGDTFLLRIVLRHTSAVLVGVACLVLAALATIPFMGGEFLPDFNEGTLTVGAMAPPGTSLDEADRMGSRIERILLAVPEVTHVSRRTGRAELDEHAENVNYSEIDVGLAEPFEPASGWHHALMRMIPGLHGLGMRRVGRDREEVLAEIRGKLAEIPGMEFNIGQPISHRLDHIMSGIRAQLAVKLFGPDLNVLRDKADQIAHLMEEIPGVVDLQVEPQVLVPQIQIALDRDAARRHGVRPQQIAEALETALHGRVVGQVLEGQRTFDVVVWFDPKARHDVETIRQTRISTPSGAPVALGSLAQVERRFGPNTINREDVMRRIVVQCNTLGRDLASVVADVRRAIDEQIAPGLTEEYFLEYGGQFQAQQEANLRLLVLGSAALVGVYLLLLKCLGSWRAALQVIVNVPLASVGAIVALLVVHRPPLEEFSAHPWWQWPSVWFESITLSVAHWVGFITLIGIVSRNGIMMISHYIHLMRFEGEEFTEQMIIRGSLERLAPVLMTATTTIIGLVPLALGAGQTGKEILHPLAVVVIGGLLSSTLLDQLVTPALFWRFGRPIARQIANADRESILVLDARTINSSTGPHEAPASG